MEVVEFVPEKMMRVKTQDGTMTINGWARFEALSDGTTNVIMGGEFP